jgi:hypothetical protein
MLNNNRKDINKEEEKTRTNSLNSTKNTTNTPEDKDQIQRLEKLQKIVDNLNGNIQVLNDEISLLKNALYKKKRLYKNNNNNSNNTNGNEKKVNIEHLKNTLKVNEPALIQVKSFNDLQLDLNKLHKNNHNGSSTESSHLKSFINKEKDKKIDINSNTSSTSHNNVKYKY